MSYKKEAGDSTFFNNRFLSKLEMFIRDKIQILLILIYLLASYKERWY